MRCRAWKTPPGSMLARRARPAHKFSFSVSMNVWRVSWHARQLYLCLRGVPEGRRLFQIGGQPLEKCFVPELAVLRLQYPVSRVGEDDQFRWHVLPLQSREELKALRVRHAVIEFAANHQGRRPVFPQVAGKRARRPFAIAFGVGPRRSLHVMFLEPEF